MSKTPEEFKNLFTQINAKLASSDPDDVKTVASLEFKQVVETLLHEFQSYAPSQDRVSGQADEFDRILRDYPMTNRFKACDFDESAMKGAWQALGIASALPGPRQQQWEAQTDEIVEFAPIALLDLVTRAYSGALSDDQRNSMLARKADIPMARVPMDDFSGLPIKNLLKSKVKPSDLVAYSVPDQGGKDQTKRSDDEGPGL